MFKKYENDIGRLTKKRKRIIEEAQIQNLQLILACVFFRFNVYLPTTIRLW
jgi:hypothetical protein